MPRIFLFMAAVLATHSCAKSEQENPAERVECSLSASIDGAAWCGQVFEIFENEIDELIVNGSRKIDDKEIDQITIYVPNFQGVGTYILESEGALYRKWCCGDLLLDLAILHPEENDSGQVIIEVYNQQTNEIRGTFSFTASNEKQINISGSFFGFVEWDASVVQT